MRVSARLLITLVFVVLVLPKIVSWYWDKKLVEPEEKFDAYENTLEGIDAAVESHEEGLLASLDEIQIEDPAFKKCIARNLGRYRGVVDGSGYRTATDIKILECDRLGIDSIRGVEFFPNLVSLSLRDNNIQDLNPLDQSSKLESIDLTGNPDIENIEALMYAYDLKSASFSDLNEAYCYEVENVLKHVKANLPRNAVSPLQSFKHLQCRGKFTPTIKKLLLRQQRGEPLTNGELEDISDYELNESRRD